jgi:hypothetical protein
LQLAITIYDIPLDLQKLGPDIASEVMDIEVMSLKQYVGELDWWCVHCEFK